MIAALSRTLAPGSKLVKVAPYVLLAAFSIICGAAIGKGHAFIVLAAAGLLLLSWTAWRLPVIFLGLVFAVMGAYDLFRNLPGYDPNALNLGGGIDLETLLLIPATAVAALRALGRSGRTRLGILLAPVGCLALWLLIEILRNYPYVGLSAFGELRTRYLILILPLFAAVSLRSARSVRQALTLFVSFSVVLPIVLAPIILPLAGWDVSAKGSLYNSHTSLGILFGLIVLWRCTSLLRWPRTLVWLCTVLGALEILVDAHRSVWIAAILSIAVLWLSKPSVDSAVRRLAVVVLGVLIVTLMQLFTPLRVWDIVVQQGGAALALEDSAMWRAVVQKAALRTFADSPLFGQGLGLYWHTYVPEFGRVVTTFPHSVYVMVLVHLGVVGALLFSSLGFATWWRLRRPGTSPMSAGIPQTNQDRTGLATVGIAALVGLAGYGIAYGFEMYVLVLIGIALAGVPGTGRERKPRP